MSRLIRNKKLIGSTSNDSSHIIYDPSDTSRSETTVKSELDRLNAGIPAIDVGNAVTSWTDTESATSTAQGASNYEILNVMVPGSTIKSLLTSIKSLLFGLSTQVTSLSDTKLDKTKLSWTRVDTKSGFNNTISFLATYTDYYFDFYYSGYRFTLSIPGAQLSQQTGYNAYTHYFSGNAFELQLRIKNTGAYIEFLTYGGQAVSDPQNASLSVYVR